MKQFKIEKLDEGYVITHEGKTKALGCVEDLAWELNGNITGTVKVTIEEFLPEQKETSTIQSPGNGWITSGWISVHESLPEYGHIVHAADGEDTLIFPCYFTRSRGWVCMTNSGIVNTKVTHLQSLLKPPTQ